MQLFLVYLIDLLSSTCHVTAGNQRVDGEESADQVQIHLLTPSITNLQALKHNFSISLGKPK